MCICIIANINEMIRQNQEVNNHCPHCFGEIGWLDYSANYTDWGTERGTASLDGDLEDTSDRDLSDGETTDIEFECPDCGGIIDIDDLLTEEEAIGLSDAEDAELSRVKEEKEDVDSFNKIELRRV